MVEESEEKETGRLEAFSDGIFAVAITLLVLEIKIPPPTSTGLADMVLKQWPSFLAYAISFLTILIMCLLHYRISRGSYLAWDAALGLFARPVKVK